MPSGCRSEGAVSPRRAFRDVSLAIGVFALVIVGLAFLPTFGARHAQAAVGPRPTVELVKMFGCSIYEHGTRCATIISDEANVWLQGDEQKRIRVTDRQLTASRGTLFLAIFYEVPEWRTPQPKSPAEAVR